MKPRILFRRYRTKIRLALIAIIIAIGVFAWSLREFPVNDNYQFVQIVSEGIAMPTSLTALDGTNYLYVSQRDGVIRILENGKLLDEPLMDLRDRVLSEHIEQGLHRVLVDPKVSANRYIYVYYTAKPDGRVVVERYELDSDLVADKDSDEFILEAEQPEPDHNGGEMQFGNDGYLYIALGDGGASGSTAYDLENYLGSILRLDVSELPYQIPEDNPFVDREDALPEIWVYGLRNPWRFSFDRKTGDMFIGDVGGEQWEEIDWIPASTGGYDFGWNRYEATHLIENHEADENVTMPIYEYPHNREGIDTRKFQCSVTGGYIYRGKALPDLDGTYIFGDWCSGSLWSLKQADNGDWVHESFIETEFKLNSFGVDADGEIYLLTVVNGIWKLTGR
jgi:glucose/arabinose dehydrogenase